MVGIDRSGMKDIDKAGSKEFGFVALMKHQCHDPAANQSG